jgi:hypothetical protein
MNQCYLYQDGLEARRQFLPTTPQSTGHQSFCLETFGQLCVLGHRDGEAPNLLLTEEITNCICLLLGGAPEIGGVQWDIGVAELARFHFAPGGP